MANNREGARGAPKGQVVVFIDLVEVTQRPTKVPICVKFRKKEEKERQCSLRPKCDSRSPQWGKQFGQDLAPVSPCPAFYQLPGGRGRWGGVGSGLPLSLGGPNPLLGCDLWSPLEPLAQLPLPQATASSREGQGCVGFQGWQETLRYVVSLTHWLFLQLENLMLDKDGHIKIDPF